MNDNSENVGWDGCDGRGKRSVDFIITGMVVADVPLQMQKEERCRCIWRRGPKSGGDENAKNNNFIYVCLFHMSYVLFKFTGRNIFYTYIFDIFGDATDCDLTVTCVKQKLVQHLPAQ